jgi:hypothetical protein
MSYCRQLLFSGDSMNKLRPPLANHILKPGDIGVVYFSTLPDKYSSIGFQTPAGNRLESGSSGLAVLKIKLFCLKA